MTRAEKKEKNRAYYLKNRERILSRARTRNSSTQGNGLSVVPDAGELPAAGAVAGECPSSLENQALVDQELLNLDIQPMAAHAHLPGQPDSDGGAGATMPSRPTENLSAMGLFCDFSHVKSGEFKLADRVNLIWLFTQSKGNVPMAVADSHAEISKSVKHNSRHDDGTESGNAISAEISDRDNEIHAGTDEHDEKIFQSIIQPDTVGVADWKFWIPFCLRLALVAGINLLLMFMQVEFYKAHDVLPQFSWPMAIVSELSFLSLVSMRFRSGMDWLRIMAFSAFFLYFVAALSFHVLVENRKSLETSLKNSARYSRTEIAQELNEAMESLRIAQKGRSWKNMEIFGGQVARLQSLAHEKPQELVLGISSGNIVWMQIILLVAVRALLMATESLNMVRLRYQFTSWAQAKLV